MSTPTRYWRCKCGKVFNFHSATRNVIIYAILLEHVWHENKFDLVFFQGRHPA